MGCSSAFKWLRLFTCHAFFPRTYLDIFFCVVFPCAIHMFCPDFLVTHYSLTIKIFIVPRYLAVLLKPTSFQKLRSNWFVILIPYSNFCVVRALDSERENPHAPFARLFCTLFRNQTPIKTPTVYHANSVLKLFLCGWTLMNYIQYKLWIYVPAKNVGSV